MAGQKTPTALGTESIGKLLMQYAVPAIIAMTASSLYNMVDSIFIGHGVGTMAISAEVHADPLDAQIFFISSMISSDSPSINRKLKFTLPGSRLFLSPFNRQWGILASISEIR